MCWNCTVSLNSVPDAPARSPAVGPQAVGPNLRPPRERLHDLAALMSVLGSVLALAQLAAHLLWP